MGIFYQSRRRPGWGVVGDQKNIRSLGNVVISSSPGLEGCRLSEKIFEV